MNGLRVGVTGARKAAQLADALERRGARPFVGPLVTTDQPVADEELVQQTDAVIRARPRWLAASTGVGMRLWAEVARRHGRYQALHRLLASAVSVARGPKAVGGMAALGLSPEHVTDEETDAAVVAWILDRPDPGQAVAAQVHGGDTTEYERLESAGLSVCIVRPYVAGRPPEDEQRARELVRRVAERELDVVTFTSPGAARNLFGLAEEMGPETVAGVDDALGRDVAVAAVGPVTGAVLSERDVEVAIQPRRHRQGALVRAIEEWHASRTRGPGTTPRHG